MYTSFFALTDKPFNLTPDPDFLYLSRGHQEALAHLTYGVESRSGFVMVTGDVGAGKTTLLRTLIRGLPTGVVLSQVTNTRVSYRELLALILEDFGVNPRGQDKTALLSLLNEFLIERCREGRSAVLVVDEAQNLSVPTLEGLRMLSNLETEKQKLLHVILAGQPGLRTLIDSPPLEQLRQRITVRYHLGPLTPGEVGEYIRHRLQKVVSDEARAPVFPDEVIPRIHEATGGLPRLVNVFCDAALLYGYVEEVRVLDGAIVDEVAAQMARDQRGQEPLPPAEPESPMAARISLLETRLEALLASGGLGAGAEARLEARERATAARERESRRRLAAVEEREAELNQRLGVMREEWKKRVRHLEAARRDLAEGVRFPGLKVYLYDGAPRLQASLRDALEAGGIPTEATGDFPSLLAALREPGAGGWFGVAVIGGDHGDCEARVAAVITEFPHVPTVVLSDADLSAVRRRAFGAGASWFLEKPGEEALSLGNQREVLEQLKGDLLRYLAGLHRQYRAFFGTLGAAPGPAPAPPQETGDGSDRFPQGPGAPEHRPPPPMDLPDLTGQVIGRAAHDGAAAVPQTP